MKLVNLLQTCRAKMPEAYNTELRKTSSTVMETPSVPDVKTSDLKKLNTWF